MQSHIFLSSLGVAVSAVVVAQVATGGGKGGDGENIYDIASGCGMTSLNNFGSVGTYPDGSVGLAMTTVGQNQGNALIPWYASSAVDHPVIAQNLYRISSDGRLEQIGQAWLKHAWAAVQQSRCGFTCQSGGNGQNLGVHCADTYSAGTNAAQDDLGPRWEIKPNQLMWMDGRTWDGSHFQQTGGGGHTDTVMHRLRVRMGDLTTSGATYWYESQYNLLRDLDKPEFDDMTELPDRMLNNARHRQTIITHNGGASFSFVNSGGDVNGPLVQAWGDVRSRATPTDDGIVYVSSRAVDLGGGSHRFEYAVMNFTLDTEVRSIQIPTGIANISDIGFHAPRDGYWTDATTFVNESPYDVGAWENQVSSGTITFNAPAPEGGLNPNTIRWSTLYTFWFTADVPPALTNQVMTLTPHLNGTVTELLADVIAPVQSRQPAALTDIAVTWGTYQQGDLSSVQTSDDDYYVAQSSIGFLATEPNVAEITVGATSPFATGSGLQATVESNLNTPGGTRRVKLRNFDTNALMTIDTYPIGTAEITEVSSVGGGIAQYVRDSDSRTELVLRTSVMAIFTVTGFLDRYDWIDIQVDE